MAVKLQFVTVFSESEFLQKQATGQLNQQISYQEYLQGCQETNAQIQRQRDAMNPFDREILEAREAEFLHRRQKQPIAA